MSLWEQYQKEHADDLLIENVPSSMLDSISSWLADTSVYMQSPYEFAKEVKNRFRIDSPIPTSYANNYTSPADSWKLTRFLVNLSQSDSNLFFVVLDYMLSTGRVPQRLVVMLETILDNAGHKYKVQTIAGRHTITERVSASDLKFMSSALSGANVYASEFQDAFSELYGTKQDYTAATGEAFQSLESALKFHLGDKGQNLGALLNWLKQNKTLWEYIVPSDGQIDAQDHFIANVDFVNKSFRKTKHGQAEAKLTIEKPHAEIVLRVVALLIFELENTIRLVTPN